MTDEKYLQCYWCDTKVTLKTALKFGVGIIAFCSRKCHRECKRNNYSKKVQKQ